MFFFYLPVRFIEEARVIMILTFYLEMKFQIDERLMLAIQNYVL